VHSQKAYFPIDVTLFGRVIDTREWQYSKAPCPIDVTLFGMDIDSRLARLLHALGLILVTL
jgi:hypothetical protein